jgi:hypothetical protein
MGWSLYGWLEYKSLYLDSGRFGTDLLYMLESEDITHIIHIDFLFVSQTSMFAGVDKPLFCPLRWFLFQVAFPSNIFGPITSFVFH